MKARLISVVVYKKNNGVWYMTWRDQTGRQHSKSTGLKDKTLARQVAKEVEKQLALSPYGVMAQPIDVQRTWSRTVDEFCTARSKLRKKSIDAYRFCGTAFQTEMGDVPLVSVTTAMLERYVNARIQKKIAAATVNKELRHFRAILRWSHDQRYLHEVPEFRKLFVRVDLRKPSTVPNATFEALIAALGKPGLKLARQSAGWWKMFLRLLHWTGFRRGELLSLQWESVDLEKREVTVLAGTSKGRQDKVLPLNDALIEGLRSWREACGSPSPPELVFPWKNGTRQLYEEIKTIEAAAGVKHHRFKDYRSSRACALVAAGESTLLVKDWMGHSSVVTTEKFYASGQGRMVAAAARLEQVEADTIRVTT